jgi:ribonuclease HI
MDNAYFLHFDGSCGPKNPGGTAAYGFLIEKSGERVLDSHGIIGSGPGMTNNLAEHFAVAEGLKSFFEMCTSKSIAPKLLHVRGDSQLVINQLNKKWSAHFDKPYYPEYDRAVKYLRKVRNLGVVVDISWIPREQNTKCDDLSKAHQQINA